MIKIVHIFKLLLLFIFLKSEASLKTLIEYNQHNFNFQDSTKNALPERYQYLSQIYYCIKHSSEKQNVVGILQFFKNTSTVFPRDIVNKISLLIAERFCIFSKIETAPNIPSRYKDVFTHFTVTSLKQTQGRFSIENKISINLKQDSTLQDLIQELKSNKVDLDETIFNEIENDIEPIEMNLSGATYNFFLKKTRDYPISIDNDLEDPKNNSCKIGSTITIINLEPQARGIFKFPNHIVLNADVSENGILAVEKIDEKIHQNEYEKYHFHHTPNPIYHAIEIYDIFTKTLLNRIKLPLPKEYRFNNVLFSLCQITNQNIYIFDLENKKYITITYKDNNIITNIQVPEVEVIRKTVSLEEDSKKDSLNNPDPLPLPLPTINTDKSNDIINTQVPEVEVIQKTVSLEENSEEELCNNPDLLPLPLPTINTDKSNDIINIQVPEVEVIQKTVSLEEDSKEDSLNNPDPLPLASPTINTDKSNDITNTQVPEDEVIHETVSLKEDSKKNSLNNPDTLPLPLPTINTDKSKDIINTQVPEDEVIHETVSLEENSKKNSLNNPDTLPLPLPTINTVSQNNTQTDTKDHKKNNKNTLMRYIGQTIKPIIFISCGFAILSIFKKYFSRLIFKPTQFS